MVRNTTKAFVIVTVIFAGMTFATTNSAAREITTDPWAEVLTQEQGFADLSSILNSEPVLTASENMQATPSCGQPGECNYTTCPATNCPSGTTQSCSCEASGGQCGFFTKYPVYNCKCGCDSGGGGGGPTAPPCTLSVQGKCVIPKSSKMPNVEVKVPPTLPT